MVEFGPVYETGDVKVFIWLQDNYQIEPDYTIGFRYKGKVYEMWEYNVDEKLIKALNEWRN